jgi:hypothetical protein
MVIRNVYLRPIRSPNQPNSSAPSGRTPKPGSERSQARQRRRRRIVGREEQPAEQSGENAVEEEVIPFEHGAERGRGDDQPVALSMLLSVGGQSRRHPSPLPLFCRGF